jgi:hypothetical protein
MRLNWISSCTCAIIIIIIIMQLGDTSWDCLCSHDLVLFLVLFAECRWQYASFPPSRLRQNVRSIRRILHSGELFLCRFPLCCL